MNSSISRRQLLIKSAAGILAGKCSGNLPAGERAGPLTTDEWIRRQAIEAPLEMRFAGTTTAECRRWQAEFAARLNSLLGPYGPPRRWETVSRAVVDLKDHRREHLLLVAEGRAPLPVYLLLPRPVSGRRCAGLLAIHGHGEHGYETVAGRDDLPGVREAIQAANYDYGRQLARRGFAVAVPCLTPFGVRRGNPELYGRQDPCADTFIRMQMLGKLLIAENLCDCLWALELLARHDEVDANRLGCVGLSYGGRMSMLTAALEPRIRMAVVSGALNVMQERISGPYSCGAQIIPGLLRHGDTPEIGSLIAPRPCVWEVGSHDKLISHRWAEEALVRVGRAYEALGQKDRLVVDWFKGGHEWRGKVAYELLEKTLAKGFAP